MPPEAGSLEGQSPQPEADSPEVQIAKAESSEALSHNTIVTASTETDLGPISLLSVSRAEVGTSSAISTENQHVCLKPGLHTMHPSACPHSDALPCTACCAVQCGCEAAYQPASDTSR